VWQCILFGVIFNIVDVYMLCYRRKILEKGLGEVERLSEPK